MYKGFHLKVEGSAFNKYVTKGRSLHQQNTNKYEKNIAAFKNSAGKLDASKLTEDWFPKINADIFLSHSHADVDLVLGLAGWLSETFGLTAFIDSTVWGYAPKLMTLLDNEYSKNGNGRYTYSLTHKTAAHVHMMLTMALSHMIHHSEAVMFVNTSNSVVPSSCLGKTATESPWIFTEIGITNLIARKVPDRLKPIVNEDMVTASMEDLSMEFPLDLSNLKEMNKKKLFVWSDNYCSRKESLNKKHALDFLYDIK